MGIWATILTIIAMYVAGRVTGHLADVEDRNARLVHGMAMFGLSVIAAIVIVVLSGAAFSAGTGLDGGTHSPYMLTVFADIGWIGFFSLLLGWLAAMGGAVSGRPRRAAVVTNVHDIRPAA
jgi:hypothetical protein